ncbi:MAG TPA: nitroreductase family protein [Anaerolineales bacterium]|nr:nitroreductase family protein [Anaerolineales bacterium]
MQFSQLIMARRSVRAYTAQPIEEGVVERLLNAVRCAPSAGNLQAYQVCLARSSAVRAALARAAGGQSFIEQAPLALVFCTNAGRAAARYGQRGATLYAVQDATIACTYAMLAAVEEGLACVWVGAFDEGAVRQAVGAPGEWTPIAILPIGYAAETPPVSPRRNLSDLVREVGA